MSSVLLPDIIEEVVTLPQFKPESKKLATFDVKFLYHTIEPSEEIESYDQVLTSISNNMSLEIKILPQFKNNNKKIYMRISYPVTNNAYFEILLLAHATAYKLMYEISK